MTCDTYLKTRQIIKILYYGVVMTDNLNCLGLGLKMKNVSHETNHKYLKTLEPRQTSLRLISIQCLKTTIDLIFSKKFLKRMDTQKLSKLHFVGLKTCIEIKIYIEKLFNNLNTDLGNFKT